MLLSPKFAESTIVRIHKEMQSLKYRINPIEKITRPQLAAIDE